MTPCNMTAEALLERMIGDEPAPADAPLPFPTADERRRAAIDRWSRRVDAYLAYGYADCWLDAGSVLGEPEVDEARISIALASRQVRLLRERWGLPALTAEDHRRELASCR